MCIKISDRYLSTRFPQTWQIIFWWFFHDHFLIFHDHLSYRFGIRSLLYKTSENANFLHRCLFSLWWQKTVKIGTIQGSKLIKLHDWNHRLFHDHFHFPGFPASVGTLIQYQDRFLPSLRGPRLGMTGGLTKRKWALMEEDAREPVEVADDSKSRSTSGRRTPPPATPSCWGSNCTKSESERTFTQFHIGVILLVEYT